jgi:predicted DNA binding protein
MGKPIIEIEEIGLPNSLIYRKNAQISEIINTEKLVEELNILLQQANEAETSTEQASHIADVSSSALTDTDIDTLNNALYAQKMNVVRGSKAYHKVNDTHKKIKQLMNK